MGGGGTCVFPLVEGRQVARAPPSPLLFRHETAGTRPPEQNISAHLMRARKRSHPHICREGARGTKWRAAETFPFRPRPSALPRLPTHPFNLAAFPSPSLPPGGLHSSRSSIPACHTTFSYARTPFPPSPLPPPPPSITHTWTGTRLHLQETDRAEIATPKQQHFNLSVSGSVCLPGALPPTPCDHRPRFPPIPPLSSTCRTANSS